MRFRGIGFKHTLSAVPAFASVWFVVLVAVTAPVITVALIFGNFMAEGLGLGVWILIVAGLAIIMSGVIGLALFTTARLAGPFVALQRAFEDVRDGDVNRQLSFRDGDAHLRELEAVFNEMMASLRERMEHQAGPGGQ